MSSYNIRLEKDTIKVDFAKTPSGEAIKVDGDQIVKDIAKQLEQMISTGEIKGGELLKIYGRISVLGSYTFAHQLGHLYRAIAVSDTRLNAYVVVISTTSDYPLGTRINLQTGETIQVPRLPSMEPSFLTYWEDDILVARIKNGGEVDGDQILKDAKIQLENLINSGKLSGGKKLLKIYGRSTVLASFFIANKLAHQYSAIAVFDPKIGYVVTISHSQGYQVGQILNIENHVNYKPVKI
ncbi:MAG: hypothetical protein MGF17_13885, partial [Trichodesmium sp. MAG_R04]|nr:hypothetical protein [Trichodesmium sp. MAG_R04]